MQIINSSQDYINGQQYYTVKQHGQKHLIRTDGKLIPFWLCSKTGIQLVTEDVSRFQLSEVAVQKFIKGENKFNPTTIFNEVRDYISTYIYFTDARIYTLLAIWTMGTYSFRIFRYFPYIHLNAEKGSGKTTLMEILAAITFNGDLFADATGAAICEEIHNNASTLFLDEAEDLTTDRSNMIMRILKSGYSKSGVIKRKGRFYFTYSPKMFAGINVVDDVLADRMIRIQMIRKLPSEQTKRYYQSEDVMARQNNIVDSLYVFGLTNAKNICDIYAGDLSSVAPHLQNRSLDIWAPILSIASLVGVVNDMTELSKEIVVDKEESYEMESESTKLLSVLNAMLVDLTPVKTNGGVNYYDADLVFSYFCAQGYFINGETRTALSRLLQQKLGIRCEPQKHNGMVTRMYGVSPEVLVDYAKRYLPTMQVNTNGIV